MGYSKGRKRKSGIRWTAYYVDPNGTERSAGTYDSEREADNEWKRMEGRIIDDRWLDDRPGKITFKEFCDEVYWPTYASIREASTRQAYYYMLRKHLTPKFGATPLGRISPEMVQGWVNELKAKKLSPSTVRKNVVLLRKILNVAIKTRRLTTGNPCAGAELPTVAEPVLEVATPEAFSTLFEEIPKGSKMLVEIGIETGFRWGELAELRRADFDPKTRFITCQRAVAEVAMNATGESTRFVQKLYPKGRRPRRVRISSPVATRLTEHILEHGLSDDDLLFTTKTGGYLSRTSFRKDVWVGARTKAGMPKATMHGLRHAHASWLLQSGASLEEVRDRMGHVLITTTQKYLHTVDMESETVIDAFTAFRNRGRKTA